MRHGAKNVWHGAKNMRHGAKNVRHGAKNVRHDACVTPDLRSPHPGLFVSPDELNEFLE